MAVMWSDLAGKVIAMGAPILGGILTGPAAPVLGGLVGNVIADALGVPHTPDDVSTALNPADPAAVEKVRAAEAAHSDDLQKVQTELADVKNARDMQLQMLTSSPFMAWTPAIISYLDWIVFTVALTAMFFIPSEIPDRLAQLLNIMIGALIGMRTASSQFWFGTTRSSQDNGNALRNIAVRK